MEEESYASIDRYLENEMTLAEKEAFDTRLQNDKDFAEKFEVYQSASSILKAKFKREEKEIAYRKTIATILSDNHDAHKGKGISISWYQWAAAASVAILCVTLLYTSFSKPEYEDYAQYEPIALVERGSEGSDADNMKLEAQEAFNNHEYLRAFELFTQLQQEDPDNFNLKLYRGIALLELDDSDAAASLFEQLRSKPLYYNRAIWMLALTALKQKDYETCKAHLRQIQKGSDEYNKAQKLLDAL